LLLKHLDASAGFESALLDRLDRLIVEARRARRPSLRAPTDPTSARIGHG
jgi:hypothetical protein